MALIGPNLDELEYEGLRKASEFKGAPTIGIGLPGNTKVLRFDAHVIKQHIRDWIQRRPKYRFMGIDDLITAVKHGQLRQGQLIFQEIPVSHHEHKEGYVGWIYNLFSPLLTVARTRQARHFAYFHVAIYVGRTCVVENGGYDTKYGYGDIALRDFEDAFEEETYGKSRYFVVSPPKDKEGRSTRYLVCQKALASIGVRFKYHMKAVSCETFATAMLGNIDDVDFEPIQTEIIRTHKKDLVPTKEDEKLKQNIFKFRKFYEDLRRQIEKVPVGIILTLDYYLNRPSKRETPWFMQMIDSYKHLVEGVKTGDEGKCVSLVDMGLALASRDRNGFTALMHAAQTGIAPLCSSLIARGADVSLRNKHGDTPLIQAAHAGHVLVCVELITQGADVNHNNKKGKTALMIASAKGFALLCSELMKRGADENQQDRCKNTALMYASQEGHVDVCRELVKNGAELDLQHEDGESALMIAAHEGHAAVCTILCEAGAKIDLQDNYFNTALMHATYERHTCACAELIRQGAANLKDNQGSTALMHAAYEGNCDACVELVRAFPNDVDLRNHIGRSALMYAAQQGHTNVCRELVKGGADVNQTNRYGRTPLMCAAREGHYGVCTELIRSNADLNLQDVDGLTALMIAAQAGRQLVYKELLIKGADPKLKDKSGKTVSMLLNTLSHRKIT